MSISALLPHLSKRSNISCSDGKKIGIFFAVFTECKKPFDIKSPSLKIAAFSHVASELHFLSMRPFQVFFEHRAQPCPMVFVQLNVELLNCVCVFFNTLEKLIIGHIPPHMVINKIFLNNFLKSNFTATRGCKWDFYQQLIKKQWL